MTSLAHPRQKWSAEDEAILAAAYPCTKAADIAAALGRTLSQVYNKAHDMGLSKSSAWLASGASGRLQSDSLVANRFSKGMTPWNKGLHYQPGGRIKESQYRPGNISGRAANLVRALGSYAVNADGVLEQKVSGTPGARNLRWRAVHRVVWEAANGPAPDGNIVVFRPGQATTDPEKITLDRLECITRAENMRRNSVHANYPPELARLAQLRGALSRQINQRAKAAQKASDEQEHQ